MMLGHLDEAVARSDEALLVARQQTNRPYHLAIALNNRVGVDKLRAGYQAGHERAVELAAVSAEHALPLFASSATLYLAERSARRGETGRGAYARAPSLFSSSGDSKCRTN